MTAQKTMAQVLRLEAECLEIAAKKVELLNDSTLSDLVEVFNYLTNNSGTLIFCGVGKSGIIAMKLASTFCSLGLPSFFLHPVEALHGDLGRVRKDDAIVLLSKSGTTEEVIKLLPFLSIPKERIIGLVGNMNSPISKACSINLDCSVSAEACINNQAPTTSSTLALAMGDALAVLFESQIGLSKEGFAINHPGGILGKSLRMKVKDLMIPANECAIVTSQEKLKDVILAMTKYPVSGCAVVDSGKFKGILVEGDIRRTFTKNNEGLETEVSKILNSNPISISPEALAFEALEKMETKTKSFQLLPVIEGTTFLGFIRLHELLKEGFSLKN